MIWKKIEGYDYSISDQGLCRNNKTGRILKQGINSSGYLKVDIYKDGIGITVTIHRLLAVYFLSCPSHMDVDHIDGNRLNNNLSNLRVVTTQHNMWNVHKAKGYYWDKREGKWRAVIGVNGKSKHLGYHATEDLARAEYLRAKATLHLIP